MWQARHCAPGLPGSWKWCDASSNSARRSVGNAGLPAGEWHWVQTALPSARSSTACGSWQSEQRTPRAYIFDWRNEPYS